MSHDDARARNRGRLIKPVAAEIAAAATRFDAEPLGRLEMRRAVTSLANATGSAATRRSLVTLAAIATAWASRLPSDGQEVT